MILSSVFECPYCEHINKVRVDTTTFNRTVIVYCDSEDGGCDGQMVLRQEIELTVTPLEIEGEEDLVKQTLKQIELCDT